MAFSLFSLMLKPGQTGTAVWGRGELFSLGVFYAAACKGIGETDLCLVGGRRGVCARLLSLRCCRHGPADTLHERRAFYGEESCASASGLIWWASDWLWALWAEHETALERRGRQWAAVLAWVIVLIGSWTWNRWEAKRGPLPHDISRTTRADVCVLGVNALFPDNVTHIQDARRNTLGASPSAKGGRFSLQRRFNCSGGPSGDAR